MSVILSSENYKEHLLLGAVDEAHCFLIGKMTILFFCFDAFPLGPVFVLGQELSPASQPIGHWTVIFFTCSPCVALSVLFKSVRS